MKKIDIANIPVIGSYISSDTLRYFISNEGYYDMEIQTGKTVKLVDAQLENSIAHIVLPNCIVESTLLGRDSLPLRTVGKKHQMKLFDGVIWREVTMPTELINADNTIYLTLEAVTSSNILLICWEYGTTGATGISQLYQIDLSSDELTIEYCTELSVP